jgi:NTP pyrophosphatase (non-canonical NTP hydrolase)
VTQELRSPLRKSQASLRRWRVTHLVQEEQARQDQKWGEQNHSDIKWLPILGEEVGEVNKAINHLYHWNSGDPCELTAMQNLKEELVHVAAVAMSWLEAIERRETHGA